MLNLYRRLMGKTPKFWNWVTGLSAGLVAAAIAAEQLGELPFYAEWVKVHGKGIGVVLGVASRFAVQDKTEKNQPDK